MILAFVGFTGFGVGWLTHRFKSEIASLWRTAEDRLGQEIQNAEKDLRRK